MANALYYGDNLNVMRESIASESVDLVYLDPPFNSQATYNLLFRSPTGVSSRSQIEAFEDTWHWGREAEGAFADVMRSGNTNAADLVRAMRSFLGDNDLMAYLAMMAVRLIELHRVLKSTGSLYLHCDPNASHYLKILLDSIFGPSNFVNEISWKRTTTKSDFAQGAKNWPRIHDNILHYAKAVGKLAVFSQSFAAYSETYVDTKYHKADEDGRRYMLDNLTAPGAGARGHPQYEFMGVVRYWRYAKDKMNRLLQDGRIIQPSPGAVPRYKRYLDEMKGIAVGDCWTDIFALNSQAQERLGYPTQKPVALLERIISASSNEGMTVLDPFCGCGTTIHAAQKLGRVWAGIDITHLAISLIERRLKDAFPDVKFDVHGTPKDIGGARDLAHRNKYQFQWWAGSLIGAQPYQGMKKGADGGIDGLIYFRSDAKTTERAIVSVKGGEHVSVPMIRDLKGVMDREKSPIGIFLTLTEPTRPMEKEAASAGFYTLGQRHYPRLQTITIEQALNGRKPAIPLIDAGAAFKRAAREPAHVQDRLL